MRSALKNFGVTFLVSLVIFGIIAYFATRLVTGTVESIFKSEKEELDSIISDTENTSDGTGGGISGDGSGEPSIDGNSFSFLLAVSDYNPGMYDDYILSSDDARAMAVHPAYTLGILGGGYHAPHISSLVLVRVDKETKSVVYLYLSPYMRVSTTGGKCSLSDVYYTYGMDRLEDHIYALTGIEVNYSFLVSGYNVEGLTNVLGTVSISNPKEVYFDGMYNTYAATTVRTVYDENGAKTTASYANDHLLASGEMEMTGQKLYTALSVAEHSKADLGTKQTVATAIAEGYIKDLTELSQTRLYDTLANLTGDNGILFSDFDVKEVNSFYDLFYRSKDFQSVKLLYPCTYRPATDNIPEYFKPDVEKGLELLNAYRKSENN